MRRLSWTEPARRDLRDLDAWLSSEADPETAIRILSAIRERADFLLDFPGGGPVYRGDRHSLRVNHTPCSLVYRVLDETRIEILRIHHAKQDWRP